MHNGAPLCKLGAILRFSCVNGEFREEQLLQLPWMMRTTHCGWLTEHNVFCEQQRCSLWLGVMLRREQRCSLWQAGILPAVSRELLCEARSCAVEKFGTSQWRDCRYAAVAKTHSPAVSADKLSAMLADKTCFVCSHDIG